MLLACITQIAIANGSSHTHLSAHSHTLTIPLVLLALQTTSGARPPCSACPHLQAQLAITLFQTHTIAL